LQALFVQWAQLLDLSAQGGVLVGVVAVGQAVNLALDALNFALGLLQVVLNRGQAAQFAFERVRLLQGRLQGVQFGLDTLLRFRVVGRDLGKALLKVALLVFQRRDLAQFGVQLAQACLQFGKLALGVVAHLLLLCELPAQGADGVWLLLQRAPLLAQGTQLVLGRLRFLLCGGQHALIGVPQWLPAGGALARLAQRLELLHARALLLQARLQGA